MCLRTLFACLLLTVTAYPIVAQQAPEVTIGFYNVENLYDTIPSPFGNDRDYTPQGRLHWDSTRYTAKLHNLARVLDALSLDVAGLAEVESEQAVRDLVITLRTDYNYFARSTSTWSDHRRLMNLCETIDAVAPVLDKIHKNGKTQNTIFESSGHYNSIHDVMLESMDECKKRKDGWILLSDVGNNLSKKGVKYEGKLCDICKNLGFEMRTEYTPGTNTGCQIYFIR